MEQKHDPKHGQHREILYEIPLGSNERIVRETSLQFATLTNRTYFFLLFNRRWKLFGTICAEIWVEL